MKKILAMLLSLVLVLSLAACSTAQKDTNTNEPNVGAADSNVGGADDEMESEKNDADAEGDAFRETENNTSSDDKTVADLTEILKKLYDGYNDELPALEEMQLDSENFQFFTFAEPVEGAEAAVSEPMMSSIAHSFVLVRLPEDTDAAAFAEQMEQNANPRKWVCVEAEKVSVVQQGNLVLLCMSTERLVDTAVANFNAMFN